MSSESDHDSNGEELNSAPGSPQSVTPVTKRDPSSIPPGDEPSQSEYSSPPSASTDEDSVSLPTPVDTLELENIPLPTPVEKNSGDNLTETPLPEPVPTNESLPEEITDSPKRPPKPEVAPSWLPDLYSAADSADTNHAAWELLKTLQYYPDEDILDVSQQFFESSSREKQVLALNFAGELTPGSKEAELAIPLLIQAMLLSDPKVAGASILSLANLAPEKLMERGPYFLDHASADVRKSFASATRKIKTGSSIDHLLTLSRDDEISVRQWSILECYRVGAIKDGETQNMMMQRLFEDDARNLADIINTLAMNRDPNLVDYLAEALSQSAVPPHIIEAAGTLGDSRLYIPLWDLSWTWTGSPRIIDPAVRACRWDDPRPLYELTEAAMDEEHFEKSEEAITALQRRGGREVFDTAEALCNSRGMQSRLVGAKVLGRIGGPRSKLRMKAIKPLSHMLEDRNDDIIATAIEGIGSVQENEIAQAVASLQTHDNPEVRNAVSVILYGIDDPASTTSMIALSTAREGMVRFAASQALDEIMNIQGAEEEKEKEKEKTSSRTDSSATEAADNNPVTSTGRSIFFGLNKTYEGINYQHYAENKWEYIIKGGIGLLLVSLIVLTVYLLGFYDGGIPVTTENPELVEALAKRDFETLKRPTPEEIIKLKKEGEKGMFEASRLLKFASMLRLPMPSILNNKKECWYLYNRMDPQDAAWVLSRAPTPKSPQSIEAQNLKLFLSILINEASSDNHMRVANLLRHLAPQSPDLASYMLETILDEIPNWQQDDLVSDFAEVGTQLQAALNSAGFRVKFHPALLNLLPRARLLMETKLRTGWPSKREIELANHLKLLNRGIRIEKKEKQ